MDPMRGNIGTPTSMTSSPTIPAVDPNHVAPGQRRLSPLILPSWSFGVIWTFLFTLHALSAAFLVGSACLYWYLEDPLMGYYANLLAPPEQRRFRTFGTVLGLLGALHAAEVLVLVLQSLRARRPAVTACSSPSVVVQWASRCLPRISQQFRCPGSFNHIGCSFVGVWSAVDGLLSVHSRWYTALFAAREVVEVAAQIVQCYRYSELMARPWINRAFVLLLAMSCAASALLYPLLRRYDRSSQRSLQRRWTGLATLGRFSTQRFSSALARLLCFIVDSLLTFGLSVVLPVAVFLPYGLAYDTEIYDFPMEILYHESKFPNLIRENQAVFALSTADAAFKLVPHLSVFFCLRVIASLLSTAQVRRGPSGSVVPSPSTSSGNWQREKTKPVARSVHVSTSPCVSALDPRLHSDVRALQAKRERGVRWIVRARRAAVSALFLLAGGVVVVFHARAMLSLSTLRLYSNPVYAQVSVCDQPMYSWFSSGVSCAVIHFNCYRHGVVTPPIDVLAGFDPLAVMSVIFSHCPALVVPASIRSLRNVIWVEVYNCTLVEWGVEAALTDATHPNAMILILAYTNMTGLPPGLLQHPFPGRLDDIEISKTNLSALPLSLPDVWRGVDLVFLEFSQFTSFPTELLLAPGLSSVSLIGNRIESAPSDLWTTVRADYFLLLALSRNPIADLPTPLRSGLSFGFLALDGSGLTRLPVWATQSSDTPLTLAGAAICDLPPPPPPPPGTPRGDFLLPGDPQVREACARSDWSTSGRYPLEVTAPLRVP
jgi:hypothetical protein